MTLTDTFTIPAQVMARQVGDEVVILDLNSSAYFGLDPVGTRVWQLLSEGKTLAEVCTILFNEYDVAAEVLEYDVLNLVEELCAKQLLNYV